MDPEIPSSLQKTGRGQQQSPPFVAQVSSNDRTPLFNPASNNNDNNNHHHHQLGNQPDMVQALFKAQTTAYPPLASFKSTSTDARTHTHTHPHHRRGGGGEEGMIPLVVFLWVSVAFLVCLAVGCLALLFTKLWCKWKGWREVRNRRKIQGEREWFRMSDLSGVGQP